MTGLPRGREQIRPVRQSEPCPVCGGKDKCSLGDRGLILCGRQEGDVPGFIHMGPSKKDPQWHQYRREDDPVVTADKVKPAQPARPRPNDQPAVVWPVMHDVCRAAFPGMRDELAEALGLPGWALDDVGFGWCVKDRAYTSPERDGDGRVVGLNRRFPDGRKLQMRGSGRGLIIPESFARAGGPILLVEGASCTAAGVAAGVCVVGRPSATGGVAHLNELLKRQPADRPVVVVGENDQKQDGKWPGKDGAIQVAEGLAKAINRPVRWALTPDGMKDVRAWLTGRVGAEGSAEAWTEAGAELVRKILAAAQPEVKDPESRWPKPLYVTSITSEEGAVNWTWQGCISPGHLTLFSALMKCGKTTFISHLLRALQAGTPFAGRATRETRTMFVSEESKAKWRERRDALGLDDHLSLICRPYLTKPTSEDWRDFIGHVHQWAVRRKCDLVVFDTISHLAPWKDENDAAQVTEALTPLNTLMRDGMGVLLFHHVGKVDGSQGRASRGSTALPAAADILLELRRFKQDDDQDRRRVLSGLGRFDEIPRELVMELSDEGTEYVVTGDRKAVAARELAEIILATLPHGQPGWRADEIHAALPDDVRPKQAAVSKALHDGFEAGTWHRGASGKKGDPFRFWRS